MGEIQNLKIQINGSHSNMESESGNGFMCVASAVSCG